ncbi:hypothetical protein [Glaciihabitans sp. dw_435]|uniref:hypothetical protein n=1 Tax=Glaciihabitans sp. dw_435 TaxID=2720081 RepID=UPI001BD1FDD1|nr:hypothetical protein [Glaciihabitans sp. dw_435]
MTLSTTDARLTSALGDQATTLRGLISMLDDALRATGPVGDAGRWSGPARRAYDGALADVRSAVRGLGDCLRSAEAETARAMTSVAGRVR